MSLQIQVNEPHIQFIENYNTEDEKDNSLTFPDIINQLANRPDSFENCAHDLQSICDEHLLNLIRVAPEHVTITKDILIKDSYHEEEHLIESVLVLRRPEEKQYSVSVRFYFFDNQIETPPAERIINVLLRTSNFFEHHQISFLKSPRSFLEHSDFWAEDFSHYFLDTKLLEKQINNPKSCLEFSQCQFIPFEAIDDFAIYISLETNSIKVEMHLDNHFKLYHKSIDYLSFLRELNHREHWILSFSRFSGKHTKTQFKLNQQYEDESHYNDSNFLIKPNAYEINHQISTMYITQKTMLGQFSTTISLIPDDDNLFENRLKRVILDSEIAWAGVDNAWDFENGDVVGTNKTTTDDIQIYDLEALSRSNSLLLTYVLNAKSNIKTKATQFFEEQDIESFDDGIIEMLKMNNQMYQQQQQKLDFIDLVRDIFTRTLERASSMDSVDDFITRLKFNLESQAYRVHFL